jgi:hypothetical protein
MSEVPALTAFPTSHKPTVWRCWVLALLVISMDLTAHWLLFQGREIVPGVIARPLGPCDVEWFGKRGGLVVMTCPHTDLIKLWLLPVEQPWFEDPLVPLLTAQVN